MLNIKTKKGEIKLPCNSNTTLVNVKSSVVDESVFAAVIQIQHLLMLN